MKEIEPCPFCGNKKIYANSHGKNIYIKCDECGATGPVIRDKNFLKVLPAVIKRWNERNGII